MVEEKESTKEKILFSAHKLFSEKGFDGTSIRDIAQAAEVNVASINYYFTSKEGLYQDSLVVCYKKTQNLIDLAIQNQEIKSTHDLAIRIFRYYIDPEYEMQKSFKMFVLDAKELPPSLVEQIEKFGPPGGAHLRLFLQKHFGDLVVSEKEMRWAVTVIFSHITHMALVKMSCVGRLLANSIPQYWGNDSIEEGIITLVDVVIEKLARST